MNETRGASAVAPGQVGYSGSAAPGVALAVAAADEAAADDGGGPDDDGDVTAVLAVLGADDRPGTVLTAVVGAGAATDGVSGAVVVASALEAAAPPRAAGRKPGWSSVSVTPTVTSSADTAAALAAPAHRVPRPPIRAMPRR